MSEKDILMELEEPLQRLKCAVNAVELMVYGLSRVSDPYADALNAIWNYLQEAESDVQKAIREAKQ